MHTSPFTVFRVEHRERRSIWKKIGLYKGASERKENYVKREFYQ